MPRFRVFDPFRSENTSRRGLPLGPDEILSLDNELPAGEVPKALAERCSDRRVFVSNPDGVSEAFGLDRLDRSSVGFRLAPGSFLGRAGLLGSTAPNR
jgi:hypothetical protein